MVGLSSNPSNYNVAPATISTVDVPTDPLQFVGHARPQDPYTVDGMFPLTRDDLERLGRNGNCEGFQTGRSNQQRFYEVE